MFKRVSALTGPFTDRLASKAQGHHFRDALRVKRTRKALTPSQTQWAIFAHMPAWVDALMKLRNRIVKVFGFDVGLSLEEPTSSELAVGDQAGFMTVAEKHPDEIICYAEDKHMAFYLSVALHADDIIVSTLVNQKTLIGRIYVNAILPFHYIIARSVINNAISAERI